MEYNTLLILMTIIFSIVILFTGIAIFNKKKYNFLIENIITYIGGGNGEVKAAMQYLSQSFRIKDPEIKV